MNTRNVAATYDGLRYELWISDKDSEGRPLDQHFLKAAKAIGSGFFNYRQRELGCASLTNDLVEEAVEAASRAKRTEPIRNYAGYLLAVFMRVVDKFLAREARLVPVEDEYLEDLAIRDPEADLFVALAERHIFIREVMDCMDADTRLICDWRLQGYSMNEIAEELSLTPNCLSVRYARGLKKAAERLL